MSRQISGNQLRQLWTSCADCDAGSPRIFLSCMILELARMRWTLAGCLASSSAILEDVGESQRLLGTGSHDELRTWPRQQAERLWKGGCEKGCLGMKLGKKKKKLEGSCPGATTEGWRVGGVSELRSSL